MIAAVVLIGLAFGQTTTEKTNGAPPSPGTQSAMGTPDEPTGTTLCELQNNPLRFAGQYIKVRAISLAISK